MLDTEGFVVGFFFGLALVAAWAGSTAEISVEPTRMIAAARLPANEVVLAFILGRPEQ